MSKLPIDCMKADIVLSTPRPNTFGVEQVVDALAAALVVRGVGTLDDAAIESIADGLDVAIDDLLAMDWPEDDIVCLARLSRDLHAVEMSWSGAALRSRSCQLVVSRGLARTHLDGVPGRLRDVVLRASGAYRAS